MERFENTLQETVLEFPQFKIINKTDSILIKIINVLLLILSFGKNKKFMTDYITTIGNTMYVPDSWETFRDSRKAIVLRHERIHLRQAKKYGHLVFSLLYLLAWFPVKFAWWRVKFEQEAYQETIKATLEYCDGDNSFLTEEYKAYICDQFTTSYYGWMWYSRKEIENWYDDFIKTL